MLVKSFLQLQHFTGGIVHIMRLQEWGVFFKLYFVWRPTLRPQFFRPSSSPLASFVIIEFSCGNVQNILLISSAVRRLTSDVGPFSFYSIWSGILKAMFSLVCISLWRGTQSPLLKVTDPSKASRKCTSDCTFLQSQQCVSGVKCIYSVTDVKVQIPRTIWYRYLCAFLPEKINIPGIR